ncbi:MAG: hypothetical protein SCM96_10905 [Acidobacteriota bacterium]|nr:hypothetical protein [Acidobacteriota bacterium]
MVGTGQKWLIGCGIGCGFVILIALLIIGTGVFFVRSTVQNIRDVEKLQEQVELRFGHVGDFRPAPDGSVPAESMEKFLAVRDAMREAVGALDGAFDGLKSHADRMEKGSKSFGDVLGLMRRGMDFVPAIMRFFSVRNQALLDRDLSPGEYIYIYVLVYYSWLNKNPGDGPDLFQQGDSYSFSFPAEGRHDQTEADRTEHMKKERTLTMKRQAGRTLLPMLRNQYAEIEKNPSAYDPAWTRRLKGEIDALEGDFDRLPYEDGLPSAISGSFEPYRARLEAAYNMTTNAFELGSFKEFR